MKSYDFSQLGAVIKEIREQLHIGQNELCRGICSQAQLSKIESGDSIPKSTTLYLISKRLGIDVNTLFEMTTTFRSDYVFEFINQVRTLIREKKYKELYDIILFEENNPIFIKNPFNYQFLLWNKGICVYYVLGDYKQSIALLERAIQLTQFSSRILTSRELEINNSKGGIYFENGEYEKAISIYNKSLKMINILPPSIYSFKIKVRILYNKAKGHTRLKEFKESVEACQKAIHLCFENESYYLVGELNFHIGYNYFIQENHYEAEMYFKKSLNIFNLFNKKTYAQHVEHLLAEMAI